ncbi:MAG: hypothetical protein PVJ57_05745 [Phycisphaerae bacterium]|jgi:hypothetical protein
MIYDVTAPSIGRAAQSNTRSRRMTHPGASLTVFLSLAVACSTQTLLLGCGRSDTQSSEQREAQNVQGEQAASKLESPVAPSEGTYTIIRSSTIPGVKRTVDVCVSKRISEAELRTMALEIKAQDLGQYERTFISYYLRGMEVGHGAWATTHFNPDLEVCILGLTAEEEQQSSTSRPSAAREVIGCWLDDRPHAGGRITIFTEGGKLFIERAFKDGTVLKKELVEKRSPLGRRFDEAEGAWAGNHWLIGADGNLQLRDNDGLISTAKKIE